MLTNRCHLQWNLWTKQTMESLLIQWTARARARDMGARSRARTWGSWGAMMSQSLDRLGWLLWKQDRCILSKSHRTITVVFPGPPRWQCTVSVQVMCNA